MERSDEATARRTAPARAEGRPDRWLVPVLGAVLALAGCSSGSGATARPPGATRVTTAGSAAPALNRPGALAVAPDGTLIVSNQGTNQLLHGAPGGPRTVLAGTGAAGFAGDGGPAVDAELRDPGGLASGPDGTVYVVDEGNNRLRAISPGGTITTVAGDGTAGASGRGGGATTVAVPRPTAAALARNGLYVVDDGGVQVLANGIITTVIRAGPGQITIDGTSAAFSPSAIAIDPAGDLCVADSSPKLLLEFSPTGQTLGHWGVYVATAGLATAPDGTIVVADYGNFAIDRVVGAELVPVVTFARGSIPGLTGAFRPSGVAVGADGTVFADTDGVNGGTSEPALIAVSPHGGVRLLAP